MRGTLSAAVIALLGFAGVATLLRPEQKAGPCALVQRPATVPDLPEASGLAVSRRHTGILWSHNDSGNSAVLFALDGTGAVRGRVRLPVAMRDWEDVSAGRCPAGDCLYLGDIGDNRLARPRILIYRVPEPNLDAAETAAPEVFTATYPDGPHNAEGLFLLGNDIFIVTRDRFSAIYRSPLPRDGGRDMKLQRIGQVDFGPITDAEASPDETTVAVRSSKLVAIYRASDITRGGTVPSERRIPITGLKEPQGEGVALGAQSMLYLISEGRPWSRGGIFTSLRCAP